MKKLLIPFLLLILLSTCKKETIEYISYDAEIFSGQDTLIYGDWKYLISTGGIGGGPASFGMSLLSIKPIGDYVSISDDNQILKGKILIDGEEYNHTRIRFCQDALRSNAPFPKSIYFDGPDTLILVDPCCDMYSHYYKRIK